MIAMPFVVVVANVAVFYGSTRMRVAAEPSLALLGATGIVAAVTKLRRRPKGAETTPDGAEHGAPTEPAPTSR